jgi:small redox-active disulfide protein 2
MKIQVFGSGCENCKKLHKLTEKAVFELGIKSEVEYVTDIVKMMEMGFITSPVLAVEGEAVITGFVPDLDKIKDAIKRISQ